jgi:hypothetical protein
MLFFVVNGFQFWLLNKRFATMLLLYEIETEVLYHEIKTAYFQLFSFSKYINFNFEFVGTINAILRKENDESC